jgi:hypothetical protein
MPEGSVAMGDALRLIHERLYDALKSHWGGELVGRCYVELPGRTPQETEYLSVYTPPALTLEAHRGKYCRHNRCKGCGTIGNKVFWASGAVLRRYLDSRGVYQDVYGGIYVRRVLAESLELERRFPDLKLYKVPIIDEPLDGDVLPGDPAWNGRFKERPIPTPPGKDPPRGRWTH